VPLLAAGCLLALGLDAAVAGSWGSVSAWFHARETGNVLVWSAVGLTAWRKRPDSRLGALMAGFGLLLALNAPAGYGLRAGGWLPALVQTAALVLVSVQSAAAAHILLAFPSGRLPSGPSRRLMVVAYAFAAADGLRVVLAQAGPADSSPCAPDCARNPFLLAGEGTQDVLASAAAGGWSLLVIPYAVLVLSRLRSATARERRALVWPVGATLLTTAMFVATSVAAAVPGLAGAAAGPGTVALQAGSVLAVPLAFLVGLVRVRLACAQVADLVRTADGVPPEEWETRLARVLGDPSVRLIEPTEGAAGAPSGARVTPLGRPEAPVALLVHDSHLDTEPELLAAAANAVRYALENTRLRGQALAAADAERRRLERNLHDGAQQRLLVTGLALRDLGDRLAALPPDSEAAALLERACAELAESMAQLRVLASGMHPAVLGALGLPAAAEELALTCPLPVRVRAALPGRLPPEVECTAYFVISEALANAVKHAGAGAVSVRLDSAAGRLRVEVADDGRGGADLALGTGLRGLADRLALAGGRLGISSPPGGGTRITAELPCG
jgi:signal transduction histidine kinase